MLLSIYFKYSKLICEKAVIIYGRWLYKKSKMEFENRISNNANNLI